MTCSNLGNIKSIQQTKLQKMAKTLFFGSLDHSKLHFYDFWTILPDLVNIAKCWKSFRTITICNIKSIQQTKLQKMAKNLRFGSLDHSKMHFRDFWMILHERYCSWIVKIILVLSNYAIWSPSDWSNLRYRPRTEWIIQEFYTFYGKNRKTRTRFFPDMRFSRRVHRNSLVSYSTFRYQHSMTRFPPKSAQKSKNL